MRRAKSSAADRSGFVAGGHSRRARSWRAARRAKRFAAGFSGVSVVTVQAAPARRTVQKSALAA